MKKSSVIDKGFFRLARLASLKSNYRVKVGCVIVLHGKPVSIGFNHVKTHPDSELKCVTIHAELDALLSSRTSLTGGTAYIYREKADASLGLARPCNWCYSKLSSYGIKKIYYTIENGYGVETC